jgi:hypothetical protein
MAEPPFGHEPSRVNTRRVLATGAVLAMSVALIVALIVILAQHLIEPARLRSYERRGVVPPPPRLQSNGAAELAALRSEEQARLESWGWTDGSHQYAHIPIERAMALYLQQQSAAQADSPSDAHAGGR